MNTNFQENFDILITKELIEQKVNDIAKQINKDYSKTSNVLLLGILKGSFIFVADLIRKINIQDVKIDFINASSYKSSTVSSGKVEIFANVWDKIKDNNIIIIDDIIDTGLTLNEIIQKINSFSPQSVKVCTLLDKPSRRKIALTPDYVGFEIEDVFVAGYGIDYAEKYRNLSNIIKIIT